MDNDTKLALVDALAEACVRHANIENMPCDDPGNWTGVGSRIVAEYFASNPSELEFIQSKIELTDFPYRRWEDIDLTCYCEVSNDIVKVQHPDKTFHYFNPNYIRASTCPANNVQIEEFNNPQIQRIQNIVQVGDKRLSYDIDLEDSEVSEPIVFYIHTITKDRVLGKTPGTGQEVSLSYRDAKYARLLNISLDGNTNLDLESKTDPIIRTQDNVQVGDQRQSPVGTIYTVLFVSDRGNYRVMLIDKMGNTILYPTYHVARLKLLNPTEAGSAIHTRDVLRVCDKLRGPNTGKEWTITNMSTDGTNSVEVMDSEGYKEVYPLNYLKSWEAINPIEANPEPVMRTQDVVRIGDERRSPTDGGIWTVKAIRPDLNNIYNVTVISIQGFEERHTLDNVKTWILFNSETH